MNIVYLHQYFTNLSGSYGTRSYEFSKSLISKGHKVTVICLSNDRSITGLEGVFKNSVRKGIVEGINIIEFKFFYSNKQNLLLRSIVFIKYVFRSTYVVFKNDFDLIYASSTPLTTAVPGILGKIFKGITFIFEVRDLWPELPKAMGVIKNPLILFALNLLEFISYMSADVCIGLSEGICAGIQKKNLLNKEVFLFPNSCDLDLFKKNDLIVKDASKINKYGLRFKKNDFIASFTGTHGKANGLEFLLEVGKVLLKKNRTDIKILLIGDGQLKKKLLEKKINENIKNCYFINPISKLELSESFFNSIDVGLMILDNIPSFYNGTSPNKFFDYIAAGLPVINNYPGWIANLITKYKIGFATKPYDYEDFANRLIQLADNPDLLSRMSLRSRELAESKFSRIMINNKLTRIVENTFQKDNKGDSKLHKFLYLEFKNLLDKLFAFLSLLILSPVLVINSFLILIFLGRPIFFIQKRPGFKSIPFNIIKFRTMKNIYDKKGNLVQDSFRLNKFGKFLRSTSIDELPALINILKGEMSFVGPRPLLMKYLQLYNNEQIKRHNVKPGLTGLAQVNGRNLISWGKKFEYDLNYVRKINFMLDIKILIITFKKVFSRKGINSQNEVTANEFNGNN